VRFSVPVTGADEITDVRVLDALGRDVTTLVHDIKPSGRYEVGFDARELPVGVYMVTVRCGSTTEARGVRILR
jgi:hypothetical protein